LREPSRRTHGSPRIHVDVVEAGSESRHKRLARLMRAVYPIGN
jgi:hypothetical protein